VDGFVGRGPGPGSGAGRREGATSLLLTEVGGDQGHLLAPGGAAEAMAIRDRLIVEGIRQHGGTILTPADGDVRLFATFPGAAQAVAAACALQREIRMQPRLANLAPRVVVHAGGPADDDHWWAATVCDQVRAYARAGQVLVGGTLPALLPAALPPGTRLLPFASQLPGQLAEAGPIYELALGRTEAELIQYTRELAAHASSISDDLAELRSNLVYWLLARPGGTAGLTRARASAPLSAIEAMRPSFSAVESLLAESLTALTGGMRLAPDELGDLEGLLFSPSIDLTDRPRTPAEVLADMAEALDAAVRVVSEAGDAWKWTVPWLARSQEDVEALAARAEALGLVELAQELAALVTDLRSLAALAPSDPLRVAQSLHHGILVQVERARAGIEAEMRQQQSVAAEIDQARKQLAELRVVHRQAVNSIEQLHRAIAHPDAILAPSDGAYLDAPPMGLGPWIVRLDELCRAGSYRQARKGLERWRQTADRALAGEREVLSAIRAPFQRRKELRGLLVALEAKAAAMGLARDAEVAELSRLARTLLFTSPTDLDEAGRRVRQYQDLVQTRTKPMQRKVNQG
jgi:hypothetical protein